ncbi:MAG: alkaline phosphatase D family protein, partial [Pseudomonadota bacterium]
PETSSQENVDEEGVEVEIEKEKEKEKEKEDVLSLGKRAFTAFQYNRSDAGDHYWGAINESPLPLFMMDTRTERQPRSSVSTASAQIVSERQYRALTDWLRTQSPDQPKLVTSSTMVLPRHRSAVGSVAGVATLDSFEGYPGTLHSLLQFIVDEQIEHVIFLSGDEHLPVHADIQLRRGSRSVRCHSLHTAGLYTPYRFANTQPEDLVRHDQFRFETREGPVRASAVPVICDVNADCYASGPGFTVLKVSELTNREISSPERFQAEVTFLSSQSVERTDASLMFSF